MDEHENVLKWGMWVYKTQNLKLGEKSPEVFSHWKRYFMWFNKESLYYGESEGKADKSIPIDTLRGAERITSYEFDNRKPPTLMADYGWILNIIDKTMIFASDSESQCVAWVDGINAMLDRTGYKRSDGAQSIFPSPNPVPPVHYALEKSDALYNGLQSDDLIALQKPIASMDSHSITNTNTNGRAVQEDIIRRGVQRRLRALEGNREIYDDEPDVIESDYVREEIDLRVKNHLNNAKKKQKVHNEIRELERLHIEVMRRGKNESYRIPKDEHKQCCA
eukprot:Tbor_TRINITY_DN3341_c0_g1::TRINITY_DN3341_c0_g1_i1::g.23452::m.23452